MHLPGRHRQPLNEYSRRVRVSFAEACAKLTAGSEKRDAAEGRSLTPKSEQQQGTSNNNNHTTQITTTSATAKAQMAQQEY